MAVVTPGEIIQVDAEFEGIDSVVTSSSEIDNYKLKIIEFGDFQIHVSPDSSELLDNDEAVKSLVDTFRNIFALSPLWGETWYCKGDLLKEPIPLQTVANALEIDEKITDIRQIELNPNFNAYAEKNELLPFHDPEEVKQTFLSHFGTKSPSVVVFDKLTNGVVAFALTAKQRVDDVVGEYEAGMRTIVDRKVIEAYRGQEVISFAELGIDSIKYPKVANNGLVFSLFGCMTSFFQERIKRGIDSPTTMIFNWTGLESEAAPLIIGAGFKAIWHNSTFVLSTFRLSDYVKLFDEPNMFRRDGSVNSKVAFLKLKRLIPTSILNNLPFVGPKVLGPIIAKSMKRS